jgi:hypothetical protein
MASALTYGPYRAWQLSSNVFSSIGGANGIGAKKNAARKRGWILFQDETGFTQQPSIRRKWRREGQHRS